MLAFSPEDCAAICAECRLDHNHRNLQRQCRLSRQRSIFGSNGPLIARSVVRRSQPVHVRQGYAPHSQLTSVASKFTGNSSGCFPGSGFAKLSVATDFQPVAEKHHPGETRPLEACESRFVRAAMSFPNSLTNNAVKKISARRSTLALGLHHSR